LHSVVPKHPVMTIAMGALPFIAPCLVVSIILVLLPNLVLWLPRVFYGG
jgi:TRAP-type C4-dicarboxylate transport system permease large subunit